MTADARLISVRAAARRELWDALRSRAVVVVTAVAVVLLAGYLVLQATVLSAPERATVGLSGQATALSDALSGAATARGLDVTVTEVADVAAGQAQVRDGSLDALVSGSPAELQVLVRNGLDEDLRSVLNGLQQQQVLLSQVTQLAQAAQADVDPQAVLRTVTSATVAVHVLETVDPQRGQRLALALVATLLLFAAVLLTTVRLTTAVADERDAGVSEILLGSARPLLLVSGRVLGLACAGLLALAVAGVVGLVVGATTGVLTLVGTAIGTLLWGLLWFLIGALSYGGPAMAAGALVPGSYASGRVLAAVAALPVLGVALGVGLMIGAPDGSVVAVVSVLPPFAPIVLPGLIALGAASTLQVGAALLLAIATIALTGPLAARVHTGGVLGTGTVALRDALNP